jgi:hypothetical protein
LSTHSASAQASSSDPLARAEPRLDAASWQPPASLRTLGQRGLVAGAVGVVALLVGFFVDRQQLLLSYLVGYLFWLSIALGCLALAMLHHLSRGGWGLVLRRTLEAAMRTLPWLALGFVPIAFGLDELYVWSRPAEVAANELLQPKVPYLNDTFFLIRALFYFVVWSGLTWALCRLSLRQDTIDPERTDDVMAITRKMRRISSFGLGAFVLTITFASFDWLMSLQPLWFSTIYGVYFLGGAALSALCFAVLIGLYLQKRPPMDRAFLPRHFHDYGKLMLAFVMLWAYFCFSQFLIIWSGNLPIETSFPLARTRGGWQYVALALVIAHFALPFALLLSRDLKRNARRLVWVAGVVLVMRWVDLLWQAAPVFHPTLTIHWLDLAALLAVGGLWTALFARELGKHTLLPVAAPELKEALADE